MCMQWYSNLKISVKLISAFVLIALIVAAVGAFGIINLGNLKDDMDEMYDNNVVSISSLALAKDNIQNIRSAMNGISIRDNIGRDTIEPLIEQYYVNAVDY